MRIVIFQDTYHPTFNGVVVSTDLFVQGLRERGHQVMLVVPRYPGSDPPKDPNVISIEAFKTDFIYPNSCLGKFWKSDLGPALRAFKPDLIHSMTEFFIGHILATYWAHKLRLPRVHTFHTQWTEYLFYVWIPPILTQPLLRLVFRLAVRLFGDAVIAPSDGFAKVLRGEWRMKSLPVDVVPTGIDLSRFKDMHGERFRARHGISPTDRVVLYLGRLGTEKNVELAIETMAELRRRGQPNLRFVVAGGGPALKGLQTLAESRGLTDIVWTGFISGQDWSDCYGAADLTLFPSLTETQGLVVLESLAAGVPLVSVKAIGPESTMAGEKGCLFAAATVEDFCDKAQRLLNDETLRQQKVKEARELAQEHSLQHRAAELEAIYERTLHQRSPRLVGPPRQLDAPHLE